MTFCEPLEPDPVNTGVGMDNHWLPHLGQALLITSTQ